MPTKLKSDCQKGSIPYAKRIEKDGCVYSIDRFSFLFRFYPMQVDLFDNLLAAIQKRDCFDTNRRLGIDRGQHAKSIYGVPLYWWQFGQLHIELWNNPLSRDPVLKSDYQPMLRLDFNPNTLGTNEVFDAIVGFLRNTDILYKWSMTRCDYAWDLPQPFDQTYVLTRKAFSVYGNSRYYGSRNSSGMLRVYNKTVEQQEKHHRDIGCAVTRCEWVQKFNRDFDFTFDQVCKADWSSLTGGQRALQYVSPETISDAIRCFDHKTAQKIKKQCFFALPFDVSSFRSLLNDYLTEYGFDPALRQDYDAQFSPAQEQDTSIEQILQAYELKMSALSD